MRIEVILVPYDSGQRGVRLGRGPLHLIDSGFDVALRALGHEVHVTHVEMSSEFPLEAGSAFELAAKLAERVRAAKAGGAFPLVLAGNCMTAVGTCTGLGPEPAAVVWLDAHGDLNTPETTTSGFLDGMALATLTGRCWLEMMRAIHGVTVDDVNVMLLGGWQLDAAEASLLDGSQMLHYTPAEYREQPQRVEAGFEALAGRTRSSYLHVDMDALDANIARANAYAAAGGFTLDEVTDAIMSMARHISIDAAAISAYDPSFDDGDHTRHAVVRIVRAILTAAMKPPRTTGGAS